MHLTHLPNLSSSVYWVHQEHTVPQVLCISSGSLSQVVTLLLDVNSLGFSEDMVSNWQPAHSLVGDSVSGSEIAAAPCLSSLVVAHLPLCLQGRRAINGSQLALLWNSLRYNPLFSECAGVTMQLWKLSRERSFLFLVSLSISQFGLLCHIRSLRSSSGHSNPVLPLRTDDATHISLPIPQMLVVDVSLWAASLLAFVVGHIFCSPLPPVMLPSEIPKLPTEIPGEFPTVWKLLLLHDPLPRMGLLSLNRLSLFSYFVFCHTSFQRDWAAFLDAWCSSPAFRSCFVEVAQHSNDLLMNFLGKSGLPVLLCHHLGTPSHLQCGFFLLPFLFFSFLFCLTVVTRIANRMLNNCGENGHDICLVPDLGGSAFNFSPLNIMSYVDMLYMAFIILK